MGGKGGDLPRLPAEDPRRGLRIALVANGKSTLQHSFGGDIDGHDLVCRFNFFVTKNFEDKVGTRTDVWFLGQLKMPGPKGFRGTKAVGHGCPYSFISTLRRHVFRADCTLVSLSISHHHQCLSCVCLASDCVETTCVQRHRPPRCTQKDLNSTTSESNQ